MSAQPPPDAYAPTLLGVVNVSPESMVTGSIARSRDEVVARARRLRDAGVAVVDLGGRSITPDAPLVDDDEEQRRLWPALEALVGEGFRVSVDTWSSATGCAAIERGASMVNFTGGEASAALLAAARRAGAALALTYMPYGDAYRMRSAARVPYRIDAIVAHLGPRVARARDAGVERVIVDPNLGILHPDTEDETKIHLQLDVVWNTERLRGLGCPLLYYAARKPERLARIMMASAVLHARPEYVRTHEPETIRKLLAAARESELGRGGPAAPRTDGTTTGLATEDGP
ncbi:MAG: dihydropteroate synthase [Myxococcota bacterium]|nr:dihydropteroate synthase [Myxococcales bacterium]